MENQTQAIYWEGWSTPLCCHRWKFRQIRSTRKDIASNGEIKLITAQQHSSSMSPLFILENIWSVTGIIQTNESQWILQIQEIDFVSASADWLSSFKLLWPIYCNITGQNKNPSETSGKELGVKNKRSATLHRSAGLCRLCATSSLNQQSDLSQAQDSPKSFRLPKTPPLVSYSHAAVHIHLQFRRNTTKKNQSQSYCVVLRQFHLTMTTGKWHTQH